MKSKIAFATGLVAGVLAAVSATLIAGQVSGLINFTAGTPARAADVNGNFNAVKTAVDDNHARIAALEASSSCAGNSAGDVMVKVGPLCVDKYEASIWANPDGTGTQYGEPSAPFNLTAYPAEFPANGNWTTRVYAVSKAGVFPSTAVTWFQAQQACALSGKRLLTNAEWQMAAAGTPDPGTDNGADDCAVDSASPAQTGARSSCVSKWGVHDMVGNASEWVADWTQGSGTPWAPAFFASAGVFASAGAAFGNDMIVGVNPSAFQGNGSANLPTTFLRSGAWFDRTNAGVFSMFAVAPSAGDSSDGFRCAR